MKALIRIGLVLYSGVGAWPSARAGAPQLLVEHLPNETGLELRAMYVAWQNPAATDVSLVAERSTDLRVWRPLASAQTITQWDGQIECRWTHQATAAEQPTMFYRLRIVRR